METNNFVCKFVTIYNLIISSISIWYFGIIALFPSEEITMGIHAVFVFITALFVIVFLSNYLLLFSKNNRLILLKINIWFAAVQILHFKIFGFLFDVRSGPEFFLFIVKKTGFNFGYSYDIWNSVFTVFYEKNIEGFAFYINLIPAIMMLQYLYLLKKERIRIASDAN